MAAAMVVGAPCGAGGAERQPPNPRVARPAAPACCNLLKLMAQINRLSELKQPPTCRLPSAGTSAPATSANTSAAAAPVRRIVDRERGWSSSGPSSNRMG